MTFGAITPNIMQKYIRSFILPPELLIFVKYHIREDVYPSLTPIFPSKIS